MYGNAVTQKSGMSKGSVLAEFAQET